MKKQILFALALAAAIGIVTPSVTSEAKWKTDTDGRWYTTSKSPGYLTGWQTIGKYTYYFEKTKYAAIGWTRIDGQWYYFDAKGRMLTNRWVDGYYVTDDGSLATGRTIDTSEGTFTVDENGCVIDSSTDTLTPGVTDTANCWVVKDGASYYYDYTGNLAKGWLKILDRTYYLDPDTGERLTGWVKLNGKRYYFQKDTGEMATGWLKLKKKTFYLKSDGTAVSGWKKIGGKYYYFSKKGRMYTNKLINKTYYVDENGQRATGFAQIDGDTYYFRTKTAKMAKGWVTVKKKKYYFNSSGKMATSTWVDGHYLQENGQMATSTWVGKYYVNKKGNRTKKTRSTGFWTKKSKTYYLDSNYEPVTDAWIKSGGKYYYFNTKGVMVKDKWVGEYYVGSDGVRLTDQMLTVGDDTYLLNKNGKKTTGIAVYNDKTYLFDRNGLMVTGWYNNTVATFYFLPSTGEMIKDQTIIIEGIAYTFDENGYLVDQLDMEAADTTLGEQIAAYALQFVGNPYVYGGTSLTDGADCSGFTQSVFAHFGISIPRTAAQQATGSDGTGTKYATATVISVNSILPGDLVFYYSPISHVGIYIGDGQIVHASNSTDGIKVSAYDYATIRTIVRYW